MLEHSKKELTEASQAERHVAESIAHRYLIAELEQDLIPYEKAARIVDDHKEQNNETWSRAVYAALMGVRSARSNGYRLEQTSSVEKPQQGA